MKFYKTLNTYKASNVEFRMDTLSAYSYSHWQFVKPARLTNTLIFNSYPYSLTTQRHQAKVRALLEERLGGYHILEVCQPESLGYGVTPSYCEQRIGEIADTMAKGRDGSFAQEDRRCQLEKYWKLKNNAKEANKLITK